MNPWYIQMDISNIEKGTVKIETDLKNIRKDKGLTQVEVAEKAHISTLSYQRYEAGERVPNVHTAQLIAQALHTSVEEIFPLHNQPDGNRAERNSHQQDTTKESELQ